MFKMFKWFFGSGGKSVCLKCWRPRFDPWVGKIPWRRKWQPTPVLLPGKSQWTEEPGGLQSMGSQESDRTERLHFRWKGCLCLTLEPGSWCIVRKQNCNQRLCAGFGVLGNFWVSSNYAAKLGPCQELCCCLVSKSCLALLWTHGL